MMIIFKKVIQNNLNLKYFNFTFTFFEEGIIFYLNVNH